MKQKSILVIEDHESVRKIIGRFLSKYYSVSTKGDGIDALTWLGQGNLPDLIILDMSMPRLNGLEFLSNIRSSGMYRHVPVIVVSGEENDRLINRCYDLGIDGYLLKPFKPNELKEKIAIAIGSAGNPSAAVA